jgi:hypothetical protein
MDRRRRLLTLEVSTDGSSRVSARRGSCAARKLGRVVDLPVCQRCWRGDGWPRQVPLKIVCLLMRWLSSLAVLVVRGDGEKNADLLHQAHLRAVLAEYQEHYDTARPHQGIGQRVPDPAPCVTAADPGTCQIRRKPVLGGLIDEYERAA